MNLPERVHILGASGSGTTSLAVALATTDHLHLDTDDFYQLAQLERLVSARAASM